jgi:hypothetical protein
MATNGNGRRRRGWLAPRDGGYSFTPRPTRNGRRPTMSPPPGSAGVGDLDRDRSGSGEG